MTLALHRCLYVLRNDQDWEHLKVFPYLLPLNKSHINAFGAHYFLHLLLIYSKKNAKPTYL